MKRRKAIQRTASILGASTLTPTLLSLLQSCRQQPQLNWQPTILSMEQARFVTALVDMLLPKTDTPGALDLQVDRFIDLVICKVYNQEAQQSIMTQIDEFNARCKEKNGDLFANLNAEEQSNILREEESRAPKFNKGVWGTAVGEQAPVGIYRSLKSMALWGYFSSEAIGKNVLSYDPIPGAYLGCIPLEDVGNSWSL